MPTSARAAKRSLVAGAVAANSRLYRRTSVVAVGAALMAARNRLRLVTACCKRTLNTGGHQGRIYGGIAALLRSANAL